jgi:hypothetical protein
VYRSAPIRPVLTVVAVQFQLGAPLAAAATLVVCAAFLVGTAASPGLTVWDGVLSFHAVGWLIAAGRRDITVLRGLEPGVSTYLTKAEGREHLIPALHAAARDLPYVSPALGGVMAGDRRGSTSTDL